MKRLIILLGDMIYRYWLRLQAKQEHRRKERRKQRRREGYEYAMTDYFAGRTSLLELEAHVLSAWTFGEHDDFDSGISDALSKLELLGVPNNYEECEHV